METIHFNEPEYCDYYTPLMVEDLTFCHHPSSLHYGKCSVIGRMKNDENSHRIYLESLKIPQLEGCQLPDGFTKILLSTDSYNNPVPLNKGVEIFGEAMLEKQNVVENELHMLETSKNLIILLGKYQQFWEKERNIPERKPTGMGDKSMNSKIRLNLQKVLDQQKSEYKPVLLVHSFSLVEEPRQLIASNLRLKLMKMKLNKVN